jgi:heterotetrameric sarcosine oxidase delta subunit
MIVIPCPHCGPRNHDEFVYAGAAVGKPPAPDAPLDDWTRWVYSRDNPRGAHSELWRHSLGCGAYLVVARDTRTHEVLAAAFAAEEAGDGY